MQVHSCRHGLVFNLTTSKSTRTVILHLSPFHASQRHGSRSCGSMVFSTDDELTWRTTPENPVREVDGFDWERCAALHNLIVRLGWSVGGRPETEMPRRTWWQRHITDQALEDEWSRRLSPSLKLFLQTAYETPPDQNFFYYANGLTWPQNLFVQEHEDEGIMCLYQITNLALNSHGDGLK